MKLSSIAVGLPTKKISNLEVIDLVKFHSKDIFNGNISELDAVLHNYLLYIGAEQRLWRYPKEDVIEIINETINRALSEASVSKKDVDLIAYVSIDRGFIEPSNASVIANQLGFNNARTLDISDACMGWFTGCQVVQALQQTTDKYQCALVITAEFPMDEKGAIFPVNYKIGDLGELNYKIASLTLGEGASATVFLRKNYSKTHYTFINDSDSMDLCTIPLDNHKKMLRDKSNSKIKDPLSFTAHGKEMYNAGREFAKKIVVDYVKLYGKPDIIIPHSMSKTSIDSVSNELDLTNMVHMTFQYLGNTGTTSVPAGLVSAKKAGKIKGDSKILACIGSAGFKYSAFEVKL